jgi:phage terminase large subunit-like protein
VDRIVVVAKTTKEDVSCLVSMTFTPLKLCAVILCSKGRQAHQARSRGSS